MQKENSFDVIVVMCSGESFAIIYLFAILIYYSGVVNQSFYSIGYVNNRLVMGKCVFNELWMQNTKFNSWLKADSQSKYDAFCTVCKRSFKLGTMGIGAVESHMKSEKHKSNATISCQKITNFAASSKATGTSYGKPAAALSSTTANSKSLPSAFGGNDTLKAEVLWTFWTVSKHHSYHSNDGIGSLFALMFSGNEVANTFSCGENKTAYLAKFGLAPFIKKQLVSQVSDDNFVLMFDESLNETTKNKQLDVHVRFWVSDENGVHVQSRYLDSQFMGHSTAQDLLTNFKVCYSFV